MDHATEARAMADRVGIPDMSKAEITQALDEAFAIVEGSTMVLADRRHLVAMAYVIASAELMMKERADGEE